tara:strand:- start:2917 stop:3621 length:705 start_codon:yes stop_codon:yes gene_type:complete
MESSRFPGKPMAKVEGKPMIQRVWQQAINSEIGEVIVACSENEIFNLITSLGGKAILTDPKLKSGTDRIYSALIKISPNIEYDYIINLQGDMPLILPEQIKKVLEPLKYDYSIGTLATNLKEEEETNSNVTKVIIEWKNKTTGKAKSFFRKIKHQEKNIFHHVGIYSYTKNSLTKFVKLPRSKNEIELNLEQYRAMDAGMTIGITFEPNIPISVDTKEDLITAESIIRARYEKN